MMSPMLETILADAPTEMGRKKKTPTTPVRMAEDVIDLAGKVAPYQGYRLVGDFLSDFLRPLLMKMEEDQRTAPRSRQAPDRPAPPKRGGGK